MDEGGEGRGGENGVDGTKEEIEIRKSRGFGSGPGREEKST